MELDFSKKKFSQKKNNKNPFFAKKNAFLAQNSALVKKNNCFQKKITSILFYKYQKRHPVKIPFKSIKK